MGEAESARQHPGHGLSRPAARLLASGGLVNAGLATSTVFVSLFFLVTTGSVAETALYAVGRYAALAVMSVAVMTVLPRTAPRRLFRAGLALTGVFYAVLIALGPSAGSVALPLGLLNGAASGVYWFGSNTLVYDTVGPGERGRYYGLNFAILGTANVVMPLVAAVVISGIGGEAGYAASFGIALAAFAAAWWTARRLDPGAPVGGTSLRFALALPLRRAGWGRMCTALGLHGFKQAAEGLAVVVLVELATGSTRAQGEYAAAAALAGVATSVLAGRVPPRAYRALLWVGAAGFVGATAALLAGDGFGVLLVYGVVAGLLYPGLLVPLSRVVLDTMDGDARSGERRGAYVLSRELVINAGRLAGVAALLVALALVPERVALLGVLGLAALAQLVVAHLGATAPAHQDRGAACLPRLLSRPERRPAFDSRS